jgi:hypothetical protein
MTFARIEASVAGGPARGTGFEDVPARSGAAGAALAMFLDGDVKALQAYHSGDRTGPIVMPYSSAWGWDIYCLLGSLNQELTTAFSVLRKRRRAMRKAMDAEQRERMLYLAGSGHSSFLLSSDRVCSKGGWRPNVGRHKVARYTGLLEPGPRVV